MRSTADVTGGKPIAVLLQPISGVSAINPLVAFPWGKERGAIILLCPGHHTRHRNNIKCQNGPVLPPAQVFYFNGQALIKVKILVKRCVSQRNFWDAFANPQG
jgi:hypothetical protein